MAGIKINQFGSILDFVYNDESVNFGNAIREIYDLTEIQAKLMTDKVIIKYKSTTFNLDCLGLNGCKVDSFDSISITSNEQLYELILDIK